MNSARTVEQNLCPGVVIRPVRDADYPDLCELWAQLDDLHGALHPNFFLRPAVPRSKTHVVGAGAGPNRRMLVAVHENGLVGAVQMQIFMRPPQQMMTCRPRAHIEDLVVDIKHRRTGVGRTLMNAATTWCKSRGAQQIVLTVWGGNEDAGQFYRDLGYREVNRVLAIEID